ncbi:hypothetical protein [Streptomyces sp. NPDC001665]
MAQRHRDATTPVTGMDLRAGFGALRPPAGATVIVHASLSAFGGVEGGASHAVGFWSRP